jgi:septum formation protein
MADIILASQSPRRKTLLEWANISFDIVVSDSDESFPESMPKKEVPVFIAANKAKAVLDKLEQQDAIANKDYCIIAADTIVLLDQTILGKPLDNADAINSLSMLSGKSHLVITGVVVLYKGQEYAFSETTQVDFHDLTLAQIEYYVEQYKPFDKAGAYAIQEWIGVVGIKGIQGDFYNVMGLPVSLLVQKLKQLGIA